MSQAMICAIARTLRAIDRVARQQRRLRMGLVEIFDDGERLGEHFAGVELQRRHPHLRIDRAILGLEIVPAFLLQMDRDRLVGQPLEVERDAHAIGGGRAEIGVELHGDPHGRIAMRRDQESGASAVKSRRLRRQ